MRNKNISASNQTTFAAMTRHAYKSTVHLGDVNGYLYFSNRTKGHSGKPVKIHSSLLLDFFCAVDPNTQSGQAVIRDIENLKVTARSSSAITLPRPRKVESASAYTRLDAVRDVAKIMSGKHQQFLTTKNVRIYYKLNTEAQDQMPTVYITDVRPISGTLDTNGGLYVEKISTSRKELLKADKANLDGKTVYISRASESLISAFSTAKHTTKEAANALFYNTGNVANELGIWKNDRLSESTKKLITELTNTLNDNKSKTVNWVAEGEGAAVLLRALPKVNGTLDKHSFKLINPATQTGKLLNALDQKKAQLKGEFISYSGSRTALLAFASNKVEIIHMLNKLPIRGDYGTTTRQYLEKQITNLVNNTSANKVIDQQKNMNGNNKTFLETVKTFNGKI